MGEEAGNEAKALVGEEAGNEAKALVGEEAGNEAKAFSSLYQSSRKTRESLQPLLPSCLKAWTHQEPCSIVQ